MLTKWINRFWPLPPPPPRAWRATLKACSTLRDPARAAVEAIVAAAQDRAVRK